MKLKHLILTLLIICLLVSPVAAGTEKITNGDFTNGLNGWETYTHVGPTGLGYANVILNGGSAMLAVTTYAGEYGYLYAELYQQNIDLTYVDELTFDLRGGIASSSYSSYDANIYVTLGGNRVLTLSDENTPSSWTTYSIDTSSYSGNNELSFMIAMSSTNPVSSNTGYYMYLDDVSAETIESAPSLSSGSISPNIIEVGQSTTASLYVSTGVPTQTLLTINYGDGTSPTYSTVTSDGTQTFTHTYSSTGTYSITAYAENSYSFAPQITLGTLDVVSLDFSATSYSGSAPLTVQFIPDSVGFTSYLWDFGDGTTSQETNPIHTYSSVGIYTVNLTGYTASGKQYTESKPNLINTNPQSITFNKTSYTEGDTALISWQLRSPDYTNYQYSLQIVPSDSLGNPTGQSIITPITLSGTSGTYEWDTSGVSGYYTALIVRSGGQSPETIVATTANIISTATLTVNLAVSGTTYTNATTITLTSNGQIIDTQTTTSGQAQFTVPTGVYIVSATTVGYATQTATVNLVSATSIIIDFVSGASEGTYPSGSGQAYASTFVTFRVQDSGTGKYLENVQVTAVGVEPTNPLEWMGNLFGGYWGENIMETELKGISDDTGTVTFAMFPNIRYKLNITYGEYTESRAFQASTLTGEYLIAIPITQSNKATTSQKITTTVKTTENKTIVATYTDTTQTTQSVIMSLYQVIDGNRTLIAENPAASNNYTQTFAPPSPSGNSYILSIKAQTESYGEVLREYGIDFPGPRVKIGELPDGAYIVMSFAILILLGAVGTYITSRMYALVIVIVGLLLWWAGWLFALGTAGGIALTFCFVLAILYYIATGGQPQ